VRRAAFAGGLTTQALGAPGRTGHNGRGPQRPTETGGEDMGVDDIINKGKEMLDQNRDKIQEALKSEQAEDISDKILDGTADAIKKVIPAEHHAKVDEVRANVDKSVGNE
jgi:hypothetical protein